MGRPEEIATVALFLASGEASFVNGVELSVGGASRQSESAVTKSRLVPADRARSGTWPCHARLADVPSAPGGWSAIRTEIKPEPDTADAFYE